MIGKLGTGVPVAVSNFPDIDMSESPLAISLGITRHEIVANSPIRDLSKVDSCECILILTSIQRSS